MGRACPESLQVVLELLVGLRWPEADEDALHAAAQQWEQLGAALSEAQKHAQPAASALLADNSGPATAAFATAWEAFCTDRLPRAITRCDGLATALHEFAGDVEATKQFIVIQLGILATEVALGVAGTVFTFGVSDVVADAAVVATRLVIRRACTELVERALATAARLAVRGTIDGLLNDGLLQGLRAANGGSAFNATELLGAGAAGAAGGLVGGKLATHVPGSSHLAVQIAGHTTAGFAGNGAAALAQSAVTGTPITGDALLGGVARGGLAAGTFRSVARDQQTRLAEDGLGMPTAPTPLPTVRDGSAPDVVTEHRATATSPTGEPTQRPVEPATTDATVGGGRLPISTGPTSSGGTEPAPHRAEDSFHPVESSGHATEPPTSEVSTGPTTPRPHEQDLGRKPDDPAATGTPIQPHDEPTAARTRPDNEDRDGRPATPDPATTGATVRDIDPVPHTSTARLDPGEAAAHSGSHTPSYGAGRIADALDPSRSHVPPAEHVPTDPDAPQRIPTHQDGSPPAGPRTGHHPGDGAALSHRAMPTHTEPVRTDETQRPVPRPPESSAPTPARPIGEQLPARSPARPGHLDPEPARSSDPRSAETPRSETGGADVGQRRPGGLDEARPGDHDVSRTEPVSPRETDVEHPRHDHPSLNDTVTPPHERLGTLAPDPTAPHAEQRGQEVARVSDLLHLPTDPAVTDALAASYDAATEHTAPFLTKIAHDMLPDLKAEVAADPGRVVVFVGRDGRSLAIATHALDPDFFDRHCTEIVLSRMTIDAAVQDLGAQTGRTFPELDHFRDTAGKVAPGDVAGSWARLTRYLERSGIPIQSDAPAVTLVDTSYKGTVQVLLSGLYPHASIQGRYAFFAESPHDPQPGTKQGYALHLTGDAANGGIPHRELLPDDPALTFSNKDAVATIEETMHGPQSSPSSIGPDGPVQSPQRVETGQLRGLNPDKIHPALTDPTVREAVKHLNLIAIDNYARHLADLRDQGHDITTILDDGADAYTDTVRRWIAGADPDATFRTVADAFVRRADKGLVNDLDSALKDADLSTDDNHAIWQRFDRLRSLQEKQEFIDHVRQLHSQ